MKSKQFKNNLSRRDFFRNSVMGGAFAIVSPLSVLDSEKNSDQNISLNKIPQLKQLYSPMLDLSPARWIWYPSERTLQNSVFLFRKKVQLDKKPSFAEGWIFADSRYKLYINGEYIQFGPAPFDPRQPEADPIDITSLLKKGENTIGVKVLYYGTGEGTWPAGKPGFIMNIDIENNGVSEKLVTDENWMVSLADSWPPGQYKRWFLRAFQEEFDARKYPYGWNENGFSLDEKWLPPMVIDLPANKPPITSPYDEYQQEIRASAEECNIRIRSIPLMKEFNVNNTNLVHRFAVEWKGDPDRYFEFITPGLYEPASLDNFQRNDMGKFSCDIVPPKAAVLTFELEDQVVGFPYFTIEASEGTVVELMVQEGHQPGNSLLMNNKLNSWTRFICTEGSNQFITFDYESLRWMQLHIHGKPGKISVSNVGVRRRMSGWDDLPSVSTSDGKVNRVLSATKNTLYNSAQDLVVDGMGRERQQYSGDVGHQLQPLLFAFGDKDLPKRYINTFSQGITLDGFFMDSWPAYDRLARISQRQLGLTMWGPIIDHGVGFTFDCYHYYLYTGDSAGMHEVYPRLVRFFNYLRSLMDESGLLPVENLGLSWIWMDSDAYTQQRHKKCSFNLYAASMMMRALAPIALAMGDNKNADIISSFGKSLLEKTVEYFWDKENRLFVDNLPWISEEGSRKLSDRSLAMAVLYDLCPENDDKVLIEALENPPENMGLSFPANAIWRLWALGKAGKSDTIIDEIREQWYHMDSVLMNNTLQEHWHVEPDTRSQWSHCAVGPLFAVYHGLAGIYPLEPGTGKVQIKPKPGKLEKLNLDYHTPTGKIKFSSKGTYGARQLMIVMPVECEGVFLVDNREEVELEILRAQSSKNLSAYRLEPGRKYQFHLRFT